MPSRSEVSALPWRFVAVAAGLLAGLWLLRQALMPFFVAMVLAYLLGPLVARLERRLGRSLSVGLVLVVTVGLAVGLLAWLLPFLTAQGDTLMASLPRWQAYLAQKLAPLAQAHPGWAAKLDGLASAVEPAEALRGLLKAGTGVLAFFLSTLSLVLVPLILYHLLMNGNAWVASLEGLIPLRHRPRITGMVTDIHRRLGGFIRGQIAVASVMAVLHGAALSLLGVPYAWLLGPLAGIFTVIPYSPYLVGLGPALVLAALEGASAGRLGVIMAVFAAVQSIEGVYLTPVWVGRASHLHSLEVLLALIAFGHWFGLVGLLFAVPLMVCVRVVLERLLEDYRAHPWFTGEA